MQFLSKRKISLVQTVTIPRFCRRKEIPSKIQNLASKVYKSFPPTDVLDIYALTPKMLFRFLDEKVVSLILT
jgi:hypothetical protein